MVYVWDPYTGATAHGRSIKSAAQNLARAHLNAPRYPRAELAVWAATDLDGATIPGCWSVYRAVGVRVCMAQVVGRPTARDLTHEIARSSFVPSGTVTTGTMVAP